MIPITYSAPAKAILGGEHAVVYGKPALVCALDMRMEVTVRYGQPEGRLRDIVDTVYSFLHARGIRQAKESYSLIVSSAIPVGRGLGSSSALSVASSAALIEAITGKPPVLQDVCDCAYKVDRLFHNNPSGVDTSASCFGGLIFFRKEFEFLKMISSLTMKIPPAIGNRLYLIDSGKPEETTSDMVQAVGKLYNRNSAAVEKSLAAIEKTVKRTVVSIMKEDGDFFAQSITQNEEELEKLGVVSDRTKKLLQKLRAWGAGKITGAGGKKDGSGYVLFYATNPEKMHSHLDKEGITSFKFSPALDGFRKTI